MNSEKSDSSLSKTTRSTAKLAALMVANVSHYDNNMMTFVLDLGASHMINQGGVM